MIEMQDVLKTYLPDFLNNHQLSYEQYKAVNALINCRSESLGSHLDACDSCEYLNISYNSCRNRHCPKCQAAASHDWVQKQQESLLDVQYFHVVFTVPDSLNSLFMFNQSLCYNLLFKAAADSLSMLSKDPKHLGADIGFTSVLHTWGQNLSFHPHLHCIVTGGGLNQIQNQFIRRKNSCFLSEFCQRSSKVSS